jgi:hypothetical protein
VLDVAISLPAQERSGAQTLRAICDAISKETKVPVMVGTIPLNMFLRYHSAQGVAEEKARDVLVGFLHRVDNSDRLSWRLLYDPGMKTYALNIHRVQ